MDNINTEEVMDLYRFGKIDEFGWWDLEIISSGNEQKGQSDMDTYFKEEMDVMSSGD